MVGALTEENSSSELTRSELLNRKLMRACLDRNFATARQALSQGADVNHHSLDNLTPLLLAAENGDVDLIILLCSQRNQPADLHARTMHGSTPLHLTVFFGHRGAMLELLRRGASVNCCENLGRYPLHFAATKKDVESAKILIRFGARVNVYDAFSESPLYSSVIRKPCVAMARLLLANKATSDPAPDSFGMGLLLEAVLIVRVNSDFEAIKALIRAGGNVNVADPVAWRTPLHLAAINGRLDLAEYLIRHGADLYAKNRAGQTPLEVAFNYRNLKVAHLIEERRYTRSTSHTNQILESTEASDVMRYRAE